MAKKLLLVEDEEFISFIYKRQFEISGYEVDTARDGLMGISQIKNSHYDLILLDIMLPGMNGIDILKAAKSDPATKDTPVIMLTNLAQEDIIQEAFKLGAVAYWIKADTNPAEIVQKINNFFEANTVKES